jgi:sulfur-oxidizing protein SoxY
MLFAVVAALATSAGADVDPLHSPSWDVMRKRFLGDAPVSFDERVKVTAPVNAEDPLAVPVMVRAEGLENVREIVVIADLNPIQKILSFKPTLAVPALSFRFKVEQSTPIRAAVLTGDGTWHVGGVWLSAAGGGCTTPSVGSTGLWQGHLLEMNARVWPNSHDQTERLRLRLIHPMDTGLANGIPAFYVNSITVRDALGKELATLDTFEPVAENPVISLDLRSRGAVQVSGRDIQGNTFAAVVNP